MLSEQGSIWRKWDLHIHSPASFQWSGKRLREMSAAERDDTFKQMVEALNASDVAAFCIMDYWTFDGYLGLQDYLKRNSSIKLTKRVFPGMELRCEAPMKERLNIHVLLSDELSAQQLSDFKSHLKLIWTERILSDDAIEEFATKLPADKLESSGADTTTAQGRFKAGAINAVVTRESFRRAVESVPNGKCISILPFDTYGGFKGLEWQTHSAHAMEFMRNAQMFEVRGPDLIDLFLGRKTDKNKKHFDNFINTIGHAKPAVSESDAHRFSDYGVYPCAKDGTPKCTWIKADCSYQGLRQLLVEPAGRTYIGERPPLLLQVAQRPTKYIKSLSVQRTHHATKSEHWFNFSISVNQEMSAVIGNKGSGKSALADIIGLLGDTRKSNHFSFLTQTKFRSPRSRFSDEYEGTIEWMSGEKNTKRLSDAVDPQAVERVRYIPQSYLEGV